MWTSVSPRLWAYAGVGGSDAQDLIISVEMLPVVKQGLEVGTAPPPPPP